MSWDVLLLRLPDHVTCVDDIDDDETMLPLGARHEVLDSVRRTLPETDLTDPTWGQLEGPGWSIELNIGSDDPVDSIMLHVRGSDDDVVGPIFRLAGELGCRVLDCSAGELVSSPDETSGWHAFQEFRDRVIGIASSERSDGSES
jgi:hypothetical protein